MEYLPGGDFYSMLEDIGAFDETVAQHYIAEVCAILFFFFFEPILLSKKTVGVGFRILARSWNHS